jgi:hypothetical protein
VQLKNLGPRNQSAVDAEKRVFGCGADESNGAIFHFRQQNILLGAVEPVDFIDKDHGSLAARGTAVSSGFQDAPQFPHRSIHSAGPLENAIGSGGDDQSQRRFTSARWAIKNQRSQAIGLDRAAKQLSRAKQMELPRVFIECARPHTGGQWSVLGHHRHILFK